MNPDIVPDFLCHYYEAGRGPLVSLSDLPPEEAERILDAIRAQGEVFASQRASDYTEIRRELEERVRNLFSEKGSLGPDRYIEAQVWNDEPLREFLRKA